MLDYYRYQNCMKKFCKDLQKHAEKIINCKRKEMIPLIYKSKSLSYMQKNNLILILIVAVKIYI